MAEGVIEAVPRPRRRRGRRSRVGRAFRSIRTAILILVALPLLLLLLYRVVDPPITTVMAIRLLGGGSLEKQWVPLDRISPHLVRSVLMSEDARFCTHRGIDWMELQNAIGDEDGRPRGASTITMQTVKNLFLWTERSWIRKGLEAPLALYAELVLPKSRIMEIYLNIVEWGAGVYGAEAAARRYFGVSAGELSLSQASRMAAILPAPHTRDAANPGPGTRRLARRIAGEAERSGAYIGCLG
jgi:monofunctional glycosyltransferase